VKATIRSDRLEWLKFIDENLKSHLKHFWKYVSKFMKKDADSIHLEVNGTSLTTSYGTADAFSKHFQSVYSNHCPVFFSPTIIPWVYYL
jgi:hypothetical protein